ncbi:uncharacterized protein LOC134182514 [Corticium candelabrum]|uniref:uncharacterized protein LOC134182514 n=1 Tax=Corticium candelabrum TaxID=121492 RepID=UPI002E25668D|nr:uncharacterized protein LOC134182514 [Corticium candelabrum]
MLTTNKAVDLFGSRYHNKEEGDVDFPSFERVEQDLIRLFKDINSRTLLEDIVVGDHLLKMADKCPSWFRTQSYNSEYYRPELQVGEYREVLSKESRSEPMKNLIKLINNRITTWVFGTSLCKCGLLLALRQNGLEKNYFLGCERYFHRTERRCKYTEDLWVCLYRLESD